MVAFTRLFEDEEGVSEVVGTILTLGITVVLFSSVYAGVSTLESPDRRDHLEMGVEYEPYEMNIHHQSGRTLEMDNLVFNILSDGEHLRYGSGDVEVTFIGENPSEWSVGQTVNMNLTGEADDLGSEVELVIQEEDTNRVIYQTDVSMQEEGFADISRAYIRYRFDWRNYAEQGEEIDIVAELSNIKGIEEENITVYVPVTEDALWADYEEGDKITLEQESDTKYENQSVQISPVAIEYRYSIKIVAELGGNVSEEWVRLNVGKKPAVENPKELEIGRIGFSPSSPSHGQDIKVWAEVYNHGPANFTTEWSMIDIFKEDEREVANDTEVTVAAGPAPTEISAEFEIRSSGIHEIKISVLGDKEWEGTNKSVELTVDPHVLVVEDRSADQLPEAELMSNALSGLNLDHEVESVETASDVGDIRFEDHSIIVWMAGNETGAGEEEEDTLLEESDVAEYLTDYVDEEGGNLWVLGVNIDQVYDGNGADLDSYLGRIEWENERDTSTSVRGVDDDGPFFREPIFDLHPIDYSDGQSQIDYHEMNLEQGKNLNKLVEVVDGDDTETYFGGGYDDFEYDQRTVTNSFLFDMIRDPGLRTSVAGEVISWATNISVRSGVDVAVTSQNIEPTSPMYLDTINITATFRNNGPRNLTLNNTARLVRNDGEEVISPPDDANLFLEANGGTASVTFQWQATDLGVHKFLVKADYFGEIDQANPQTNDITYKNLDITDDEIYANVHYSTLVVDADLSGESFYDTSGEVIDSFDRLGHVKGSDYEVHKVEMDDNEIESGPSYSKMDNFNSIFWITGERGSSDDAEPIFTDEDIGNIEQYLNRTGGGNMMFMGEHILDFLQENNEDHLIEKMGIDNIYDRKGTDVLIGKEDNPVGHGLKYEVSKNPSLNYTTFDTNAKGDVLFKGYGGNNFASTYDDGKIKTVYMGLDLERIREPMLSDGAFSDWPGGEVNTSSESARTEFVFASLWNFGKGGERVETDGTAEPQGRTELRVTDYDIELTTDRPHTGRSYEVRAEIENLGYRGASALIRFYDGEDYIGAENLFVESSERESEPGSSYFEVDSGTATAEVSWSPSEPGIRDLIVKVDPEREVDEIEYDGSKIMEFNNRDEVSQPVYFFYDDMENGEENWRHDQTLVNIDGTGPLDFADRENMDTNVEGDWDHDYSGMTYEDGSSVSGEGYYETDDEDVQDFTDGTYYSSPRSYWMPETPGAGEERKPMDISLVIDSSGSMDTGTRMEDAKAAAKEVVDMIDEERDRVSIYEFDSYVDRIAHLESDKGNLENAIDNMNAGGATALFDASAYAVKDMDDIDRDSVKGIILLTDGVSNNDDVDYKYAPGEGGGKGGGNEPEEPGIVQQYSDGNGLLGIPYNVFTVTIGDTPEARMHSISATANADLAYGVIESDSEQLSSLFSMFISDMMQTSQGGIRSVSDGTTLTHQETMQSQDDLMAEKVENTEFVVFSDAFRDKSQQAYGYGGEYEIFQFDYNDGYLSYDGDRTSVISNDNYDKIVREVDPSTILSRLDGSYEIKGAYLNFLVSTWSEASLQVDIKMTGENEWTTIADNMGDTYGYQKFDTSSFATEEPFKIRFMHDPEGEDGVWDYVLLDDISVTYELDYTPGNETSRYLETIDTDTRYRYTTTPSIDVSDTSNEKLTFNNKYWMTEGTNGGIMYLWGNNAGSWDWNQNTRRYIRPEQSYTGNLDFDMVDSELENGGPDVDGNGPTGLIDAKGEKPYWAFNGKSAGGTFGWRHTSVNIAGYDDFMESYDEIRVVFVTAQMGGISSESGWQPEMGWYIDNVNLRVTREFEGDVPSDGNGYWMRVSKDDLGEVGFDVDNDPVKDDLSKGYYDDHTPEENGAGHFWMFAKNDNGEPALPQGVDSSLYTSMIDLSNAEDPELLAHMKFNLDNRAGTPPDGLRIEVSDDNGRTWDSLTYGVRSGWGVSGHDKWGNYSGYCEGKDYGWVNTTNLDRVSADLSGWRGENIIIRFRVFTNTTETYEDELDDYTDDYPKAIFIDDVIVKEADMEDEELQSFNSGTDLKQEKDEENTFASSSEELSTGNEMPRHLSEGELTTHSDAHRSKNDIKRDNLVPSKELRYVKEREEYSMMW